MKNEILKINSFRAVILFAVVASFMGYMAYIALTAQAQQTTPARKQSEIEVKMKSIEDNMFAKNKGGCGQQANSSFLIISKFQAGVSANDVGSSKIMNLYIGRMYDKIRKKGLTPSVVSSMGDYVSCVENSTEHKEARRELKMARKHIPCAELSSILLNVLGDVKRKIKPESIIEKYKNKKVNLSNTGFDGYDEYLPIVVGKVALAADKGGYESAANVALFYSAACRM